MQQFQLNGVIHGITETKTGTSQKGNAWTMVKWLCKTDNGVIPIISFKDTDLLTSQNVGKNISLTFEIAGNEYNGKNYANLNGVAIALLANEPIQSNFDAENGAIPPTTHPDLPF